MSVLTMLVKGGAVMLPLACASVISVAVVLDRASFWWRRRGGDADRILELAGRQKWDDALAHAVGSRSPVAHVLRAGLESRDGGATAAMQIAAREESAGMRRYLPVLDTIVTLSPLLGLLGTVTGMIGAFGVMSASGMNQPHAITGGVAEALIATATGLGIAIATLVPLNYFSARAERGVEDMEREATRLEQVLAREP